MEPNEILVHFSAPTSKKGDERYQALALAYQEFETKKTINLTEPDIQSIPSSRQDVDFIAETPLAVNSLECQSLTSPLDFEHMEAISGANHGSLELSHKHIISRSDQCEEYSPSAQLPPLNPDDTNTEQFLHTLLSSEVPKEPLKPAKQEDPAPVQLSRGNLRANPSEETASPPDPPTPSSQLILPTQASSSFAPSSPSSSFTHDPEPPTRTTPFLALIVTLVDPSQYFTPYVKEQTRPLRAEERGHWSVSTASWDAEVRNDFWALLLRFIGDGRCGFGVWCCSEGLQESFGSGSIELGKYDADSQKENREPRESGVVKTFCWGEVVTHVYLLLMVASRSKVLRAGAVWVDSEGKEVVQMGELQA